MGKNEPLCIADEVPFEIPESWEWVRWGTLSESIQYGYNAPAQENGRIKMVRISDIQDNSVMWETVPYCDIKEGEIDAYLLKPNDILFARTGGTVGKSYLVQEVPEEAIYAGYLIRTRYSNQLCPQYLKYFMESELYWSQLREGTIATAQPNCNGKTLGNMLVPIPPSHEQIRIVEKLNAVMAHVIEYGTVYSKSKHLNNIFPERLKKSILQEAVQGKLVPQDPNDEPASVLLERIRAEKQKLVAEGKIKKISTNPSFSEGIILIMKSVILRKSALMMNFLMKYPKRGVGQEWEVVWMFEMEHTIHLSMLLKAFLL
ncbi:restriction endonuclease subunit S [Anaerobutyricum hallii]|nr:restriction endonuclease subunit S [Anaerobutyricum hallii]